MLGDKFNRFQQFDAEYNTALAEYETIDKAAAKVKKKLDSITEEINEINKKIVEANLDEKNQGEFDKLVELVRDRHQKADKIMSEIESRSEEIKAATDKVIEARNKRQKSLEYIAERGVLIRNQDGTYSLGKYKMESINGVPYTSDYAKVFLNAASKYDKFADIDARSESAFSAFK
jgi:DNA repair exonuclease SbcCD ATPase subunit